MLVVELVSSQATGAVVLWAYVGRINNLLGRSYCGHTLAKSTIGAVFEITAFGKILHQVAMDDYYDFEIVNSISTADWILLMLVISFWLFL